MIESESFRIVAQNPGVSERPRCLASVHNKFTVLQAKQNLELKPKTNNKKKKTNPITFVPNHLVSRSKFHEFVNLNMKLTFSCKCYKHPDNSL